MLGFKHKPQWEDRVTGFQPALPRRPYTDARDSIWGQQQYMSLEEAALLHHRAILNAHRADLVAMGAQMPPKPGPLTKGVSFID